MANQLETNPPPEDFLTQDAFFLGYYSYSGAVTYPCVLASSSNQTVLNQDCDARISIRNLGLMKAFVISLRRSELEGDPARKYLKYSELILNYRACTELLILNEEVPIEDMKAMKSDLLAVPAAVGSLLQVKVNLEHAMNNHFLVGAPSWAQKFVETIKSEFIFKIYVCGDAIFLPAVRKLQVQFARNIERSPLLQMFQPGQRRPTFYRGQLDDNYLLEKVERLRYTTSINFESIEHYATELGLALKIHDIEKAVDSTTHQHLILEAKILKITDYKLNTILACLPAPTDDRTRLKPGDSLTVYFEHDTMDESKSWSGHVTPRIVGCPASLVTVWLHRPRNSPPGVGDAWEDNRALDSVNLEGLSKKDILNRIIDAKPIPIKIVTEGSQVGSKQAIDALETLLTSDDNELGNGVLYQDMLKIFSGNRLDLLPERDIFRQLRGSEQDFISELELDQGQRAALEGGKCSRGPLLIHGSPGTGKTHLVTEVFEAYTHKGIEGGKPLQMLFIAPTSESATEMAFKLQHILSVGINAPSNFFVVHVRSDDTRQNTFRQYGKLLHPPNPNCRLTQNTLTEEEAGLLVQVNLASAIHKYFVKSQKPQYDQACDSHVDIFELSLSYRMLQYADILPGGPKAVDLSQWLSLRTMYSQYQADETDKLFPQDEIKKLGQTLCALRAQVFASAAAICSDADNAGAQVMREACINTTNIIIADDATQIPQHVILPILVNQFADLGGVVLLGDPHQLRPVTITKSKKNVFRGHLDLSLLVRLAQSGLVTYQLLEQHRMLPCVAAITTKLTYKGLVRNAPTVAINTRHLEVSQVVRKFNLNTYGKDQSILLLDVEKVPGLSQTLTSKNNSRYNEYYVAIAANLVVQLLQRDHTLKIAYLSAYSAQATLGLSAKAMMEQQKIPGVQNFQVSTWAGASGREWDVVIYDILMVDSPTADSADIQDYPDMMTVVNSRARCGMYLITDKKAIDKHSNGQRRRSGVKKFMSAILRSGRFPIQDITEFPQSDFFKPGQVNMNILSEGFDLGKSKDAVNEAKTHVDNQFGDISNSIGDSVDSWDTEDVMSVYGSDSAYLHALLTGRKSQEPSIMGFSVQEQHLLDIETDDGCTSRKGQHNQDIMSFFRNYDEINNKGQSQKTDTIVGQPVNASELTNTTLNAFEHCEPSSLFDQQKQSLATADALKEQFSRAVSRGHSILRKFEEQKLLATNLLSTLRREEGNQPFYTNLCKAKLAVEKLQDMGERGQACELVKKVNDYISAGENIMWTSDGLDLEEYYHLMQLQPPINNKSLLD